MEYVEAYEPRAGFVHPPPLGEITSIAAQHVDADGVDI
jgi:hypothetical protein